jgi:hypothetical protein
MIPETLQAAEEIALYPLVSLVLFFVCFGFVILWAWRLDKTLVDKIARLPLDDTRMENEEGEVSDEQ